MIIHDSTWYVHRFPAMLAQFHVALCVISALTYVPKTTHPKLWKQIELRTGHVFESKRLISIPTYQVHSSAYSMQLQPARRFIILKKIFVSLVFISDVCLFFSSLLLLIYIVCSIRSWLCSVIELAESREEYLFAKTEGPGSFSTFMKYPEHVKSWKKKDKLRQKRISQSTVFSRSFWNDTVLNSWMNHKNQQCRRELYLIEKITVTQKHDITKIFVKHQIAIL